MRWMRSCAVATATTLSRFSRSHSASSVSAATALSVSSPSAAPADAAPAPAPARSPSAAPHASSSDAMRATTGCSTSLPARRACTVSFFMLRSPMTTRKSACDDAMTVDRCSGLMNCGALELASPKPVSVRSVCAQSE
jgi:hypothetical protein